MTKLEILAEIKVITPTFAILQKMVEMKPKGKYYRFDSFAGLVPAEPLYKQILQLKRQGGGKIAISRIDDDTLRLTSWLSSGQPNDDEKPFFVQAVECKSGLAVDKSLIRDNTDFLRELARERGELDEKETPLEPTDVVLNYTTTYGNYIQVKSLLELVSQATDTQQILIEINGRTFCLLAKPLKDTLRLFARVSRKSHWVVFVSSVTITTNGEDVNQLTLSFLEYTEKYALAGLPKFTCYLNDMGASRNFRLAKQAPVLHLNFRVYGKHQDG